MPQTINMIESSKNFDGNLASFLRLLDNPQALGRYVMDSAYEKSFFSGFPGLIYRTVSNTDRVGDIIYIDEKFNTTTPGIGLPGPYKSTRQLAGNESIIDAAYRRDKMTVGITRHAVAIENYLQTDLLPEQVTAKLKTAITTRATLTEDNNIACTLYRDYPCYYAELDGLTATEIDERILPMFGRGTYNDVGVDPSVIMPNNVTDIEALTSSDTLSDVFLEDLQRIADQELGMPYNQLEDGRPFFSMIVGDSDVMNFFRNASSTFKTDMNYSFMGKEWKSPIFQKFIGEYANIRLVKYGWMANNDGRDEFADHMSVRKHMKGSPYEPRATVLAAARGDQTVTDFKIWNRGAFDLTTPANRAGFDGHATTYNLYLSFGALDLPYFEEADTTVGASSYNKFALTATETANTYCGLSDGDIVGRLQIGEYNTSGGKYKILYTGPVYAGSVQLAANKTKYAQVQSVYKVRVVALYTRDGSAWNLVDDAGMAAAFTTLKTFLGIDSTNHIITGGAYGGLTYAKNRKAHVFNTVRTLLVGKDLIFDADILGGQRVEQEKRDYGAVTGRGMTMSKGKKIAINPDGVIRNYCVVIFKRPSVLS